MKLRSSIVLVALLTGLVTSCQAGSSERDESAAGNRARPKGDSHGRAPALDRIPACRPDEALTYDHFDFAVSPDGPRTAASETVEQYAQRWFSTTYPEATSRGGVRREQASPDGHDRFSLVHGGTPKIAIEVVELPTGELAVNSQVGCARFVAETQRDVPVPEAPR